VAVARRVAALVSAVGPGPLGGDDLDRLREILTRLREITDPYA
jgi:hypothetical protein